VSLLLPDGGETPYPAYVLRVLLLLPDGGETPYPAYVLRGAAFVAGWRLKRLIRPTCCGVLLLLPDGGENALSGLRVAVMLRVLLL